MLTGGEPGDRGLNLLLRKDCRSVNLGGKTSVNVDAGDVFCLRTPGGGGYGKPVVTVANSTPNMNGAVITRRVTDIDYARQCHERGSVHAYRMAQESA